MVRSRGFWNSSILPNLLLVARLFPCYTQDSLPLRCQSVSERSFGGLEPPCAQRNGPLRSDSGVTSSFGNVFNSSFNNRTGFLANDPLSSDVDWKLEENGSQPVRRISHDSVNIFINRLNKHRAIFLAWNVFLEVQPPKIPLSGYELKYDGFCHFPTYVRKQGRSAVEYMALLLALKGPRDTRRE